MCAMLTCWIPGLYAQRDSSTSLLESIELAAGTEHLSPQKVEAGAVLAFALSGRYRLLTVRDSAVRVLRAQGKPFPAIAQQLGARWLLRIRLSRFHNLLRADVELRDSLRSQHGSGYALIRHRWEQTDEPVDDPAIAEALQRALCVAVGDSLLYARADTARGVRPAALLAVTTIEVRDNPSLSPLWELFDDGSITSYSGILAIITAAQRSPHYVTIDIDTRDSMYAYFRLYEPEPTMPPSPEEIAALRFFGVECIVTGTLERTQTGAQLELQLKRIEPNGSLVAVARTERALNDDSRVQFLQTIAAATEELLRSPLPH